MRQPSKSRRRNTCVSAPNRTSRSESSYRADFQCEMRAVVGSQSAPIGTPPNCRSDNRVRGIRETREGSRFGAYSHDGVWGGIADVVLTEEWRGQKLVPEEWIQRPASS